MRTLRRVHYALAGTLIGIIGLPFYLIFEFEGFKFFYFIIPLFLLSVAFHSEDDYMSMKFFLGMSFVYMLFSMNCVTFDASHPINLNMMFSATSRAINIIMIVFTVGIPIFWIIGIVWAFSIGKIDQAAKGVVFLVMFLSFTMLGTFLMDAVGINLFGITGWVADFYSSILNFIVSLPINLYNGADGLLSALPLGIDLPDLPSESSLDFTFDAMYSAASSLNYTATVFTIHDALPLLMTGICAIFTILFAKEEWEVRFILFFQRIDRKIEFSNEFTPGRDKLFPNFSYFIVFYMIFLLVAAFYIYLSYTPSFGENPMEDYRYIGYFGPYLFFALIPLMLMVSTRWIYYRKFSLPETIEGIIVGFFGLWVLNRLFITEFVMDAYSVQSNTIGGSLSYIVNNFIFIAPAETLLFHVALPGMVAQVLRNYNGKRKKKPFNIEEGSVAIDYTGRKEEILDAVDMQILIKENVASYYERNQNTKGEREALAEAKDDLASLQIAKKRIEKVPAYAHVSWRELFGDAKNLTYFIAFGVILSNFLFSTLHWILLFAYSRVDFFTFWLSGLGVIYFSGGCWFTLIALRYNWFSSVSTHGLTNTSTHIMIILAGGLI